MKINVDAPIKQKEIIELLESQADVKYTYLGKNKVLPTQIQFEVEPVEGKDMVAYTKALIKGTSFGKSIALRVLEDGKLW